MNMLFRNFFYSVGFTALFFLYQADPNTVSFADLVRLVQSARAQQLVLVFTALLVALEFTWAGFAWFELHPGRPKASQHLR